MAVDVVCILTFAIVGRRTHQEGADLLGVLGTAWPFLVGCGIGWIIARAVLTKGRSAGLWASLIIWACTVVLGLTLRVIAGSTAQFAFIVVATITLGLLLVGWRAIARIVNRVQRRPRQPTGVS